MGLFDVFKNKPSTHEEKVDLAYRCYKPEMVGMVFPGGKNQASNIICSIAKLIGKDLDCLDAKGYYELLSIYSDVLIRKVVTHGTDDNIVTSLQIKHGQEIKNKAVAQKVLAYCTINMQNYDFCLDNTESMEALGLFDNILSQNEKISESNNDAQMENFGDLEYGFVPEKPIYVKGVKGSNKYLKSLRTVSGESIIWERRGSISVDGINGMIDIYDVSLHSGKAYKTLYLNMYGTQDSTIAPKGFSIEPVDLVENLLTPQKDATDKQVCSTQPVKNVLLASKSVSKKPRRLNLIIILDIVSIAVLIIPIILSFVILGNYWYCPEELYGLVICSAIAGVILKILSVTKFKNNPVVTILSNCCMLLMLIPIFVEEFWETNEYVALITLISTLLVWSLDIWKLIKITSDKYHATKSYKMKCYKKINLLNEYLQKGVISQEEFDDTRKQIVSKIR